MTTTEHLEALEAKATPGDLSTAERHISSEWVECPACQGEGEVEASDYCNFDGVALGVQFYGIGKEFGAHEDLWKFYRNHALPLLRSKDDEITRLKAERDALARRAGQEAAMLREIALSEARPGGPIKVLKS